jgi:hypothetical protein
VKIIVGQAAGSASDIVARVVAQFLSEKLGQQFLVEVRPGAAGNIATEAVTHMPPDGYTLLLVNSQNAINVALYEKLSFDFVRDIAPVGRVENVPLVMEVRPSAFVLRLDGIALGAAVAGLALMERPRRWVVCLRLSEELHRRLREEERKRPLPGGASKRKSSVACKRASANRMGP